MEWLIIGSLIIGIVMGISFIWIAIGFMLFDLLLGPKFIMKFVIKNPKLKDETDRQKADRGKMGGGTLMLLVMFGMSIFLAIQTELALDIAFLGMGAIGMTILLLLAPIWGVKNIIVGPHRILGAIGAIVLFILWFPILSAANTFGGLFNIYLSVGLGQISFSEALLKILLIWQRALDVLV